MNTSSLKQLCPDVRLYLPLHHAIAARTIFAIQHAQLSMTSETIHCSAVLATASSAETCHLALQKTGVLWMTSCPPGQWRTATWPAPLLQPSAH